jgi:signal transduction histidine kinase
MNPAASVQGSAPFSAPHSLRVRLPALISSLIVAVLSAFLWSAYREVKRTLLDVGGERAQVAADQIAGLMAQTAQARLADLRRIASDTTIRSYMARPDDAARPMASRVLSSALGPGEQAVALWDARGSRLLVATGPAGRGAAATATLPDAIAPSRAGLSPLFPARDSFSYEIVAEIPGSDVSGAAAGVIGYVVAYRSPVSGVQTSNVITRLIGNGALVAIGNRDGSAWTNLRAPVPAPGVDLARPGIAQSIGADGPTVGALAPINRTQWALWVEFPQSVVTAPARAFLKRMLVVALLCVIGAALLASVVSARITTPLHALTKASEAIASGDYSRRVATDRLDEIGRLGVAFNAMTVQLQSVHHELDERVRQRTEELEAAVKQLEAFSYSVSHDLRAPLRAIAGFSRILIDDHLPSLAGEAAIYLRRVADGARQMGQLVDDLLAFARLGRAPVQRRPVLPGAIVQEVLHDLRDDYGERDVRLTVGDLPACLADPSLLKQVYVNLLSNAFKFSRNRSTAVIEIGCAADDAGANVYFIRDNGVGFDMRYADRLFGVFQRLHRAEEYEGTGVGLAIVQRIVTRHGGRVWADATLDGGACFSFTVGSAA